LARIDVGRTGEDERVFRLTVRVAEDDGTTEHEVGLSRADHGRLAREGESPEAFVRRCFEFLLAREPKESILEGFDVAVIARYFPEFEREISRG
jgi:hypothetical protein